MDPRRVSFLNLKITPARLNVEEAAWFLGFCAHDVHVLVAHGLLKPLGHPASSAVKYFAFVTLQDLRNDPKWLAKATDAMAAHWRRKNASKSRKDETTQALSALVRWPRDQKGKTSQAS